MVRTFANFATEKEYFRLNPVCDRESAWGTIDEYVDYDIRTFISVINALPYTFSKGMCCSGSFRDHGWSEASYQLTSKGRNGRYGVRVEEPQGYAVLRMNDGVSDAAKLRALLARAKLSVLLPSANGERRDMMDTDVTPRVNTYTYQIFLPIEQRVSLPEDQDYMGRVWRKLVTDIAVMR